MNKERLLRIAKKVESENSSKAMKFFKFIRNSSDNYEINSKILIKFRSEIWDSIQNEELSDDELKKHRKTVQAFIKAFESGVKDLKGALKLT